MQPQQHRTRARVLAESGFLGLVLGLLVVAPWIGSGYLLLLDWVSGPEQALTPGVYGLSGSALDAMPFRLGTQVLRELVGPAATAWLLILAFFPIAAAGAAAAAGGGRWRAWPAALLMVCNPFVIDRIRAGHVAVLLGMAILPWLFAAALHARRLRKPFAVRPALWYALAISISPHMAWIGGVLLVAVALLPRPTRVDLIRTVQVVVTAGLVYGYALVLYATGTRTLQVTEADLDAYATDNGPGGWIATVLSLRGFWRAFDESVESGLGLLPGALLPGALLLVGVLIVVVLGFRARWGDEADRLAPLAMLHRPRAAAWSGGERATGRSVPAGLRRPAPVRRPCASSRSGSRWWSSATPSGSGAASSGWPSDRARPGGGGRSASRCSWLPGWSGASAARSAPVSTPRAGPRPRRRWARRPGQASCSCRGMRYQPFGFTDGRTVATPASAFFARPTLVSDAVELPGLRTDSTSLRSAYVDRIVGEAGADALGPLLAPLGVEYVAVAEGIGRTGDTDWVAGQPGVERVMTSASMTLYRVTRSAVGRVKSARVADFDAAVLGYRGEGWGTEAVLPSDPGALGETQESAASGGITRSSPTAWSVAAGEPGWVVLPEEWSAGWAAQGTAAVPTLAGTAAVRVGPRATEVVYGPWRLLRPAILGSLAVLVALIIGGLVEHRRELSRR